MDTVLDHRHRLCEEEIQVTRLPRVSVLHLTPKIPMLLLNSTFLNIALIILKVVSNLVTLIIQIPTVSPPDLSLYYQMVYVQHVKCVYRIMIFLS